MLTEYERELVEYWANWKPGMKPFKRKNTEKKKVKHTKNLEKRKKTFREIMEKVQFELGLSEEELDDLLIPEEEWDDFED